MHPISDHHFIGGELWRSASSARIEVLNPSSGLVLGEIPDGDTTDLDHAVTTAVAAGPGWADQSPRERSAVLVKLANLLRVHTEDLARLDSMDSGRTLAETRAQVSRSAEQLEYCAAVADKLEGRVVPLNSGFSASTMLEPYGVIGALTPWNAPLLQITQKTSHAIAAGNTVVVKPSPLACFSTLHYGTLAQEAGLPAGVLSIVMGGAKTGQALVQDERIAKVTFTGSVKTGRQIAGVCGARGASVALELGGKCPLLIFADCDLEAAAVDAARASFGTTGQSCVSAARILVEAPVYDEFLQLLKSETEKYIGGDPLHEETVMGPMISSAARNHVVNLLEDAISVGAQVAGGEWPTGPQKEGGFFMNPVLLADVPQTARIKHEEIFGPVTCIERFDDEEAGVRSANTGFFGLAAGAYTMNASRVRRLQRNLRAGNVWINCYKMLDPALPFGGDKASGIGRECGIDGILNFVKPKSLVEAIRTN